MFAHKALDPPYILYKFYQLTKVFSLVHCLPMMLVWYTIISENELQIKLKYTNNNYADQILIHDFSDAERRKTQNETQRERKHDPK